MVGRFKRDENVSYTYFNLHNKQYSNVTYFNNGSRMNLNDVGKPGNVVYLFDKLRL